MALSVYLHGGVTLRFHAQDQPDVSVAAHADAVFWHRAMKAPSGPNLHSERHSPSCHTQVLDVHSLQLALRTQTPWLTGHTVL